MKSNEYWAKRFKALEERAYEEAAECVKRSTGYIDEEIKNINKEIAYWLQRFGKNNKISIEEAQMTISKRELEELNWSVEEYIKRGRDNDSGIWSAQLENASARWHITRLEALKAQMNRYCGNAMSNVNDELEKSLRKIYKDTYIRTAYEVQNGTGIYYSFAKADENKLKMILEKPWAEDGLNFSERIWGSYRPKIANALQRALVSRCVSGQSFDVLALDMSKESKKAQSACARLIYTESAQICTRAEMDSYDKLGVEKYRIVETLDSLTCDMCGEMDGKVFERKGFMASVTAPPFHPRCRGTTVPEIEDEVLKEGRSRAAREAETGKTANVEDMSYKEWKEKFEKTYDEDDIEIKRKISKIKKKWDIITRNKPPKTLEEVMDKNEDFADAIDGVPELYKNIIFSNKDKLLFAKTNTVGKSRYNYNYGIFVNLQNDYKDKRGKWTATFHEIGHNIDDIYGRPSSRKSFINALKNDFSVFTNDYMECYNIDKEKAYEGISKWLNDGNYASKHIISDLFGALSNNACVGKYNHMVDYWKSGSIPKIV